MEVTAVLTILMPVITSVLSYFASRHKGKVELQTFIKQQETEIAKLKQQQDLEIAKIREQSAREIERVSAELDKQAELYEKNKQADMVAKVFDKVLEGDISGLNTLMKLSQQIEDGGFPKAGSSRHRHK